MVRLWALHHRSNQGYWIDGRHEHSEMKGNRAFLSNRVGRRIFFLFVLAAFLPFVLAASLTVYRVRDYLAERGLADLRQESKAYANSVAERLALADRDLTKYGADLPADKRARERSDGDSSRRAEWFDRIDSMPLANDVSSLQEQLHDIGGFSGDAQARLLSGGGVLTFARGPIGGESRLVLWRLKNDNDPRAGLLAALINPQWLWGKAEDLSYSMSICVLNQNGDLAHCSDPRLNLTPELRRQIASGKDKGGHLTAELGNEAQELFQNNWQLYLKPLYQADYLQIVALKPAAEVMGAVDRLLEEFVGVVVVALLLVMMLSASQIRRTTRPLDKLTRGARRIAKQDFGESVRIDSNDEFGELGMAFDDMSRQIGRQLDAHKLLAHIDKSLLSRRDMQSVLAGVLPLLRKDLQVAFVGFAVRKEESDAIGTLYLHGGEGPADWDMDAVTTHAIQMPPPEYVACRAALGSFHEDAESLFLPSIRVPLPMQAFERVSCFFIEANAHLGGMLLLPSDFETTCDVESKRLLRSVADRLGVALSALSRDARLTHQASHDDLTGLPNRMHFRMRLMAELSRLRTAMWQSTEDGEAAHDTSCLVVLFVDIDKFKLVNDTRGHLIGDQVLIEAARRIAGCLGELDELARLGGDEFAIILPSVASQREAEDVAVAILRAMRLPFLIAGQEHYLGASIGISCAPKDGLDGDELLRKADTAMYRAKERGRGRFQRFEVLMNIEDQQRLDMERALRGALANSEFVLHYQPKLDLRSGEISGVEALIRWQHPVQGLLGPNAFIPIAEAVGLIEELGHWVLIESCRQIAQWRRDGIAIPRIAINVSAQQLLSGHFANLVAGALEQCRLPGSALELEVTESLFMENIEHAVSCLNEVRKLGVTVAIDDFGTGYSSLSYLKTLPIDVLKIDKSFIDGILDDHGAAAIARTIVSLSQLLQKEVVAEGVETHVQLDQLRSWGCDSVQGYYFAKPLDRVRLEAFVGERAQVGLELG